MADKNFYSILGLESTASEDDIRRAFRRLARDYHPDANADLSSDTLFQLLSEAYAVLSHPERREIYDTKMGFKRRGYSEPEFHDEFAPRDGDESEAEEGSPEGHPRSRNGIDIGRMNQMLRESHPPKSGGIASASKQAKSLAKKLGARVEAGLKSLTPKQTPIKAKSKKKVTTTIPTSDLPPIDRLRGERVFNFTIDALESLRGATREIAMERKPGASDDARVLLFKIPAGVEDGETIQTDVTIGEAVSTFRARVRIVPHPFLERDGLDLTVKLPISIGESIIGAGLDVPGLDGPVRVLLPEHWDVTKKLRVKGQGLKHRHSAGRGDLYVQVYIVAPDHATPALDQAIAAVESHYLSPVRRLVPRKLGEA